jgi:hypothetical protein
MAVQTVNGQVQQTVGFAETATLAFNTAASYPASLPSGNLTYAAATAGALNCDTIYAAQVSLASTTLAINLFNGSLLSPSGKACVFARVREFIVTVVSPTAGYLLEVYATASTGVTWLPLVATFITVCANGGQFRMSDPNSITTNGLLVVTGNNGITFNSVSNTVVFNVLIVGNSSAS